MAYVSQSFGVDQLSQDYRVECSPGTKYVLIWNRAEAEPTEEQLEAALNIFNWDNVRIQRDSLLALSDVYMSDDMATYRQALRDLPESVENSEDVVWPEKP